MQFDSEAVLFERPYPSANAVLLPGAAPVLVDPGFGSDVPALTAWLGGIGTPPEHLASVVNTHYHSDHVGGNHALQREYGLDIAAHAVEADAVNRRDPEVCAATWLRQPVEAYRVHRPIGEGDTVDTGTLVWIVLHTPGHTDGHISLYEPRSRVLVGGDVVHATDVGWLHPYRESTDCLDQSLDSLDRIASLRPRLILSGHGPAITDPELALARARARLERWVVDPEGMAWHAAKRIFAYALMIEHGLARDAIASYLEASPWFRDIAAAPFSMTPDAWVSPLLDEMIRSGAAEWRADRLVACGHHIPPAPAWARTPTKPADWSA